MAQKSSLGWILLLAVLAVPALLFHNWWGAMKSRSQGEASRPASEPADPGSASNQPQSPEADPSTAAAASAVPSEASAPPGDAPGTAPAANPSTDPSAAASESPAGAMQAGASAPDPNITRDPTMSPVDLKRLAQEALQREMARRQVRNEAERIKTPRRPERPAEPPIDSRIELYGIVATPHGISAMVNDRILNEGDRIFGAIVKKITTNTVIFEYKKRTFYKRVSK